MKRQTANSVTTLEGVGTRPIIVYAKVFAIALIFLTCSSCVIIKKTKTSPAELHLDERRRRELTLRAMELGDADAALSIAASYLQEVDGVRKARLWYGVADQLGDPRGRSSLKALDSSVSK